MSKPIIAIDIDGVLAEPTHTILELVNEEFGTTFTPDDIDGWDFDYGSEEINDYYWSLFHADDLYDNLSLTGDQLDAIAHMRQIARVIICSSPLEGHIQSKYRWAKRYFERKDIILASDKSLIDAEYLIDDGPHNVESFPGMGIVFNQPYNQEVSAVYPRVTTLMEAYEVILEDMEIYGW